MQGWGLPFYLLQLPVNQMVLSNADGKSRLRFPALTYYYDIQSLSLGILQAEGAGIENRMILLGMALFHIDTMVREEKSKEIPSYINKFLNEMEAVDAAGQLQEIKAGHIDVFVSNLFSALSFMDRATGTDTPYNLLVANISANLQLKKSGVKKESDTSRTEFTFTCSAEIYRGRQKGFQAFMKDKEYFLENLTVAAMFYFNTPFRHPERGVWNDYTIFIWTYAMLKFTMTATIDESSTVEDMIDCCAVMFRKLGHSSKLYDNILKDMETNKNNSVAHMAVMLKSC